MPEFGIRDLYPRLTSLFSEKFSGYLGLIRPFTLLAPLVGVLSMVAMAVQYGYTTWEWTLSNWRTIVHGAGTMLLVQSASNAINQAHDVEEDTENKPYRPIPRGLISREEALTLGHVGWFIGILRAATLNAAFGTVMVAIIVFSYVYSSPPMRATTRHWWGNLVIALPRGLLGVVAGWTIVAPWHAYEPWLVGATLFVFLTGAASVKDFEDLEGDRAAGARTIVVKYGPRNAALIMVPFVILPLFMVWGIDASTSMTLHGIGLLLVLVCTVMLTFWLVKDPMRENTLVENTKTWFWMYAGMMAYMVAFSLHGWLMLD